MREFFIELGIKLPDVVSGFLGGVVNAFIMRDSRPWSVIASVLTGAIAANYLVEPVARYLSLTHGPTGFLIGLTAMVLCQGALSAARKWRPFTTNGGGKDA